MRNDDEAMAKAPYELYLERNEEGKIRRKVELVAGKPPRELWYTYTGGKLQIVRPTAGSADLALEMYQYNNTSQRVESWHSGPGSGKGNLRYHYSGDRLLAVGNASIRRDGAGFRHERSENGHVVERYHYSPEYKLLRVEKPGKRIDFDHDEQGLRSAKYVNGQCVETYQWHDLVRLDSCTMQGVPVDFVYTWDDSLRPDTMLYGDEFYRLYFDHVGSLRVVADMHGNVIKEVLYDSFGRILSDTNPAMLVPLGFGGGLHDRDIGWVRMGYRDYDPETGRFTAKDPLGYAGGDSDLYGYCLDDPINLVDPEGLKAASAVPGMPPLPLHPVFIPGTPANDDFVKGTKNIFTGAKEGAERAGDMIEEAWEGIKPKPRRKFEGYKPVDYNPSHHNDQYDPKAEIPPLRYPGKAKMPPSVESRRHKGPGKVKEERNAEGRPPATSGNDDWYNLSDAELKAINKDKKNYSGKDRSKANRIRNELKKQNNSHFQTGDRSKIQKQKSKSTQ